MKARVITIGGHEYSERMAHRCVSSAATHGLKVELFPAVTAKNVQEIMQQENLCWSWADNNTKETVCAYTSLQQFPYRAKNVLTKMACSMSHYLLWKECAIDNEPMLILEHDAVFVRPLPRIEFDGAIQINDPRGGGYRGKEHSNIMTQRGTEGVHPLTRKREHDSRIPDGFSGNSAYIVKPWAAEKFIRAYKKYGVWPNDATICLQLFPWLEEYYPFITIVKQSQSTSTA
jgi:GR25 family glycosyltransferase involved in LPS biosynthesis